MRSRILYIVLALNAFVCGAQTTPREQYAATLSHFSDDSLKYKAALYLIDNMEGHASPDGDAIKCYCDSLMEMWPRTAPKYLEAAWKRFKEKGEVSYVPDNVIVNDAMLINYVEKAFSDWHDAPWAESITFSQFCDYILPYRVKDERLSQSWREALRQRYIHMIDGVTDMKKAYEIVCDSVRESVKYWTPSFPYTLDVLTYDHIQRATCDQQCILLASILRSLGIPAVVDGINKWADYSTMGHAWVALVMSDGSTYTIFDHEHEAKRFNLISASVFDSALPVTEDDGCPIQIKRTKSVSKILRYHFHHTGLFDKDDPKFLYNPFVTDVSAEYGLDATLTVPSYTSEPVYLCTFLTGKDWVPVAKALPQGDSVTFNNIGKGIVYLPVVMSGERRYMPISPPLLVGAKGIEKVFEADDADTRSVTLTRKYPLCLYISGEWKKLIGGCFEASATSDFALRDTVAVITSMPYGKTVLNIDSSKQYRYVRFKSPDEAVALVTEMAFCSDAGEQIRPIRWISEDVDTSTVRNLADNNRETRLHARKAGYSVGIECEKATRLSQVSFFPASDGNDVEAGHLYELYMFDNGWRLLDSRRAEDDSITFHGIPRGALLLLRDKTRGREERIFEYIDNQQQWY